MIKINLENTGHLKIDDNYFNLNSEVLNEFEDIFEKYLSPWENTSVINKLEILSNFKILNSTYNKIIKIIKFNSLENKLIFDDIWFSKTQKSSYKNGELPNIPHIDKIRKFKIMIYLCDVNLDNGPLFLSKCNVNKYENLRINLKKNYKENLDNQIKDIPISEYLPMTGKFGASIFFDTNTPHFAGPFSDDFTKRKIIRLNFRYI